MTSRVIVLLAQAQHDEIASDVRRHAIAPHQESDFVLHGSGQFLLHSRCDCLPAVLHDAQWSRSTDELQNDTRQHARPANCELQTVVLNQSRNEGFRDIRRTLNAYCRSDLQFQFKICLVRFGGHANILSHQAYLWVSSKWRRVDLQDRRCWRQHLLLLPAQYLSQSGHTTTRLGPFEVATWVNAHHFSFHLLDYICCRQPWSTGLARSWHTTTAFSNS